MNQANAYPTMALARYGQECSASIATPATSYRYGYRPKKKSSKSQQPSSSTTNAPIRNNINIKISRSSSMPTSMASPYQKCHDDSCFAMATDGVLQPQAMTSMRLQRKPSNNKPDLIDRAASSSETRAMNAQQLHTTFLQEKQLQLQQQWQGQNDYVCGPCVGWQTVNKNDDNQLVPHQEEPQYQYSTINRVHSPNNQGQTQRRVKFQEDQLVTQQPEASDETTTRTFAAPPRKYDTRHRRRSDPGAPPVLCPKFQEDQLVTAPAIQRQPEARDKTTTRTSRRTSKTNTLSSSLTMIAAPPRKYDIRHKHSSDPGAPPVLNPKFQEDQLVTASTIQQQPEASDKTKTRASRRTSKTNILSSALTMIAAPPRKYDIRQRRSSDPGAPPVLNPKFQEDQLVTACTIQQQPEAIDKTTTRASRRTSKTNTLTSSLTMIAAPPRKYDIRQRRSSDPGAPPVLIPKILGSKSICSPTVKARNRSISFHDESAAAAISSNVKATTSSNPKATSSFSSTTKSSTSICYQVGEALRESSHSVAFTSCSQASIFLSKMPLNSPVFVKRTSRGWTYAKLMSRTNHLKGNEVGVIVSLDIEGKVKKVLGRNKWQHCIRLVNTVSGPASGSIFFKSHHNRGGTSTSPAPAPFQRRNSSASFPSTSTSDVVSLHESASSSSASTVHTANNHLLYQRRQSAPQLKSNNNKSVSFHGHTEVASSTSNTYSGADDNTAQTFNEMFPPSSSSVAANAVVNAGDRATKANSSSILAKAPKALSKSVSFGDVSSLTFVDNTPPGSVMSHADMNNSMVCGNVLPSPFKSDDSSSLSPNTVAVVNLDAKTFYGTRRDRMKPSIRVLQRNPVTLAAPPRRVNSVPSLASSGSLSEGSALSSHSWTRDDASYDSFEYNTAPCYD